MKLTSALVASLLAMGGMATASTLALNVAVDTTFNLATTLLGTGFTATGGWYDTTLGLDYANITANFVSVGSIAFPYSGNSSYNGYATGDTGVVFNAVTLGLQGKNVFWFVTDGATGFALLEDTGIQFKLENAIPNSNASDLNASTYANFTQHVTAAGSDSTSIGLVSLVPEPSAALLGAVGALVLLRRRRI
jgi:hypothetical protein